MSSSVESTFEKNPESNRSDGSARTDTDKTVIRQDELLDAPSLDSGTDRHFSHLAFRQSASQLMGQQLDHFRIESLIGTGGMGAVFSGRDLKLDREVAIKVVPIADRGAEAMKRFRVEAQSAAKLDHPNIARVYYVGETEYWSYIVFEFVEGVNLRELVVKKGLLSIDDAVCLTRQVAEALQHAHERKVVHRDIKPSNILVTQAGQAKLVDMGLARTTELDKSTNDLTASGVTLGTFDYISPEQAHDPRQADVRSDIYSLGCTLYFLLTGQPPFPEGTALQKLLMHGTKMPEDPRFFRSDISDSMIAILRKMMAKKPADRYQIPTDLIHDLRTLAELEGLDWASASDNATTLPAAAQRSWLEATLPLLISLAAIFGTTVWLDKSSYLSATFPIPRVGTPDIASVSSESSSNELPAEALTPPILADKIAEPAKKVALANEVSNANNGPSKTASPVSIEQTDRDTLFVDSEPLTDRERGNWTVRSLEQALELVIAQPQINKIVIKSPSIATSLASLKSIVAVNSNLTIQADAGQRCNWIVEGPETASDALSSLAWLECNSGQLVIQDIDLTWRVGSMSRRRSLFSVRSGALLQLKNCSVTVLFEQNAFGGSSIESSNTFPGATLPSIIVIETGLQDDFVDAASGNGAKPPARISCNQIFVRGQCDWLKLTGPIRTEVQIGNSWFALAGSMFELSGSRSAVRTGVPLRMDLRNVTSYSQRAWMRVSMNNVQPFPIPFVRTAKECVFTGCKSYIEWNASECDDWELWGQSNDGQELSRWIDLRGIDNVYDGLSLSDYLTVRLNKGSQEQIELGADSNLVSDERGLETIASWRKRPSFETNRLHEVTAETMEWNRNAFHPGFQSRPE
jgi:eukaryotic-like serine/threonine-protein kinase